LTGDAVGTIPLARKPIVMYSIVARYMRGICGRMEIG